MLVLFAASVFFIGFLSIKVLGFTLIFSTINYFFGIAIEKAKFNNKGNRTFWISIFINIGILAFFKYINFFFENLNFILEFLPTQRQIPYLSIIIPIGISYYTFQVLGYLIRINRGTEKAQMNYINFTTFLIFFPKFLSGPVERSNHFFPQVIAKIKFDSENVTSGLRLFIWGMFKKVVIADNIVDPILLVYNDVYSYSGIPLIMTLFLQTIHLYCDFSGYTDMALGSAKIFGIDLIDNFRRPFFAKTVGELWRRWHISLSSWCNDFIFTPFIVKYRKMGNTAMILGIFITFFVIGIWHGANWTYVILGILQGVAISYEFYTKRARIRIANKLPSKFVVAMSRITTFIFFSFSLVFFNAHSVRDAWYLITHLFVDLEIKSSGYKFIFEPANFILALVAFFLLFMIEVFQEKGVLTEKYFVNIPRWLRWAGYYGLIVMIYYYLGGQDTFVYLQF
jgi:D-alanyl-lipoteichoic acid acyltransferase DltB (MBOAT superfamily)